MNDFPTTTCLAVRCKLFTNGEKNCQEVTLKLGVRYHGDNLNSWYLHIIEGAVTGFEGCEFSRDWIEKSSKIGWCACAGTKGSWDSLKIPAEEMTKIWKFFSFVEVKT
jgi:hypothetical protein